MTRLEWTGSSWAPVIGPVEPGPRPRWSVMIPAYNSVSLLARTLESVLVQDPGPEQMQIEVVDDGSTDDPAELVARLAGTRVTVFRQDVNVGASANFTTCVRRSRGEWVHILHSDDMVLPGFYARYEDAAMACPDAVMVAAQTITVDVAERYLGITPPLATVGGRVVDAALTIATEHPLAAASVVIARAAYEAAGGFHPDLAHTNDWEMWTRIASLGPVAWVSEPMALYRGHEASDSNRVHHDTRYLDECLEAAAVFAGYFPAGRRDAVRRGAARSIARYANSVGYELVGRGYRKLAIENAWQAVRIDRHVQTITRAAEVAALAVGAVARERATTVRSVLSRVDR